MPDGGRRAVYEVPLGAPLIARLYATCALRHCVCIAVVACFHRLFSGGRLICPMNRNFGENSVVLSEKEARQGHKATERLYGSVLRRLVLRTFLCFPVFVFVAYQTADQPEFRTEIEYLYCGTFTEPATSGYPNL